MTAERASQSVPAVQIKGLSVAYDSELVLDHIDLSLPAGRLIAVVGPNGAGKSTLLRTLVGSLKPSSGSVHVHGQAAERQRRAGQIAYMPQHEQVDWDFPLSVRDVVLSGRYGRIRMEGGWRRFLLPVMASDRHQEAVREALKAVDMHNHEQQPIETLSGGQRKRVLLARALAQDARLLLLDEPLVGVDRRSEELIMEVLRGQRDQGRTVVMVTHDIAGARRDADIAVLINRCVVGTGDPDKLLSDDMISRTATAAWLSNREKRYQPDTLEVA
ncbi:MAG: metal ABC transporter ATP-binding protein [Wenzhouxiangella sp.]|nr:MAG: metal ABC transporter ATP-binding protein [Wenzhouxiangella sp.]